MKHKHKEVRGRKKSEQDRSKTVHTSEAETEPSDVPTQVKETETDDNIWKGPAKLPNEKSREEEFEEYLEDLFLWLLRPQTDGGWVVGLF